MTYEAPPLIAVETPCEPAIMRRTSPAQAALGAAKRCGVSGIYRAWGWIFDCNMDERGLWSCEEKETTT